MLAILLITEACVLPRRWPALSTDARVTLVLVLACLLVIWLRTAWLHRQVLRTAPEDWGEPLRVVYGTLLWTEFFVFVLFLFLFSVIGRLVR
jgi:RsiW-degrading membrane proteinase PrsW (M82 family)